MPVSRESKRIASPPMELLSPLKQALSTESSYELPNLHGMVPGAFQPPQEPSTFANGATSSAYHMCIDSQGLLTSIVSNKTVQDATGLDRQDLLRRFTVSWSAESAFRNCAYFSLYVACVLMLYGF